MSNSSEFVLSSDDNIMSELTEYKEIPSKGFNRIFKVKRYGQWFILKTLKEEFCGQTLYKQLLKKEFEIGVGFNHPNVVRYMSFEPSTRYGAGILMEYIDGVTLREYMREGYDTTHNEKIVGELIDAIGYLHKLQLTHRDLKPENIMITRNGQNVKIIDFGLSDADHYAIFKQPAGTVGYSSPEVMAGEEGTMQKQDLYALGKIISEMMPGRCSVYGIVSKKCCKGDYDNVDGIKKSFRARDRWRNVLRYVGVSAVVSVIFLVSIFKSDMYSENKLIQEDKDKKEELRELIYREIDAMYEDFEMLLDTNTYLLSMELDCEMGLASKPWPDKLDSIKQLVDTKELGSWVFTTFSQYLTEKQNVYVKKIQEFPTSYDLFKRGDIDYEEMLELNKRFKKLYPEIYNPI